MTIQEIFDNVFHALMPFDFQFFLFLVSGLTCYAKPFFFQFVDGKCHIFPPMSPLAEEIFPGGQYRSLMLQINSNKDDDFTDAASRLERSFVLDIIESSYMILIFKNYQNFTYT
jgi:hypothetical protein